MRNRYLPALALALVLCALAGTALAGEIKDRMIARKPLVAALLADGAVGENNQGFLDFRGAKKQADVVAAENQDRAAVYRLIAKKAGTTPDMVGQRRAARIAESAPAGTWLQKPDGSWYRK
ncbi:YdbL family protein [Pseudodesulfovibrio sp.]|uniref:YdbL family protein n=1 Tax=Pseudodesulfovibrio sp. TaxID=2035812 RepID=UPI00261D27C2|nr:YdbL family protein [Pseudodesulfovibrio sp.]MDD3312547.1 YdbL family protein [Pseudodesulfovibrio sp.]